MICIKYAQFNPAASSSLLYAGCFPGRHVLVVLDDVDRGCCGLDLGLLDEDGGVDPQLGKMAHDGPDDGPLQEGRFVHNVQGERSLGTKAARGVSSGFCIGNVEFLYSAYINSYSNCIMDNLKYSVSTG